MHANDAVQGSAAVEPARATVLVADDEGELRELMKAVLEDEGYDVVEAADGDEAIAQCRKHDGAIKLLVLDVIMPRMNANEAYAAILEMRPGVKALFISGHSRVMILEQNLLQQEHPFLSKPFSPATLRARVRELLRQDRPCAAQ
jgi:two-component system cell cycle sensor histidine kinase/response regulator CckA